MASTEAQKDPKDQQAVTKRPGSPGGEERPRTGTEAPLADVQHDGRAAAVNEEEHEGATEQQVSDRGGPGVGFDQEPEREKDEGGVS